MSAGDSVVLPAVLRSRNSRGLGQATARPWTEMQAADGLRQAQADLDAARRSGSPAALKMAQADIQFWREQYDDARKDDTQLTAEIRWHMGTLERAAAALEAGKRPAQSEEDIARSIRRVGLLAPRLVESQGAAPPAERFADVVKRITRRSQDRRITSNAGWAAKVMAEAMDRARERGRQLAPTAEKAGRLVGRVVRGAVHESASAFQGFTAGLGIPWWIGAGLAAGVVGVGVTLWVTRRR